MNTTDELDVVSAFRRARSGAGIDWLRAVREAGRLADTLTPSRGKRSSSELTIFCNKANVTRQAVHSWRKVWFVPEDAFERYCAEVTAANHKPSIKGALGTAKSKPARKPRPDYAETHSIRIEHLSEKAWLRLLHVYRDLAADDQTSVGEVIERLGKAEHAIRLRARLGEVA